MRNAIILILFFSVCISYSSTKNKSKNSKKPTKIVFERNDGSVYEKYSGSNNFVEIIQGRENKLIQKNLVEEHIKTVLIKPNGKKLYSYNLKEWYDYEGKVETSNDLYELEEFKVYPNPSNKYINLEFKLKKTSNVKINLFTTNGVKIANLYDDKANKGLFQFRIKSENYYSGVYICQVLLDNDIYTQKVVIK